MSDDLVEMARLAQHDERMSTGALYGDLADHIEGLEELLWAAEKDASEAEAYAGELEAKLSESEALLAKAVAGMMALTDVSTLMQSSSSHNRFRHNTTVTDSIWSQWSTQLKFARTTLAELTGGKDE